MLVQRIERLHLRDQAAAMGQHGRRDVDAGDPAIAGLQRGVQHAPDAAAVFDDQALLGAPGRMGEGAGDMPPEQSPALLEQGLDLLLRELGGRRVRHLIGGHHREQGIFLGHLLPGDLLPMAGPLGRFLRQDPGSLSWQAPPL